MTDRYLLTTIREDAIAGGKMAFVSGPRQVGKTTLAKALLLTPGNYQTWDDQDFRRAWSKSPRSALSERGPGPLVLDEIHKDRKWKTRLKGIFDVDGAGQGLVVTGSARLDLHQRGGDSLTGRYLPYRLHPLTVGERASPPGPEGILSDARPERPFADLIQLGGFPEPFYGGSEAKALRWSRLRTERLLGEDVRDLRAVGNLSGMGIFAGLLPERVGSVLSLNSLREDVGVAYGTAKGWLQIFESLYHCFLVPPYSKRVARALRLAPKLYLFDVLRIPKDRLPARHENATALHLLKACQFWTDAAQGEFELRYLRDKEQREVDFLILRAGKPWLMVECKSNDITPSPSLAYFQRQLGGNLPAFQLVSRSGYDRVYTQSNLRVLSYERFLAGFI